MKKILPLIFVILFLIIIANFVISRGSSITQPINYNHKKHIEDAGLSCNECHQYVETLPKAGLPQLRACLECHEEALTESSEEKKLLELAAGGKVLAWNHVYRMPQDVYFSHQRHVKIAQIECEKCHGKVEQLSSPPTRPAVKLSMSFCMKCHEKMNADNDCIACHK